MRFSTYGAVLAFSVLAVASPVSKKAKDATTSTADASIPETSGTIGGALSASASVVATSVPSAAKPAGKKYFYNW